MENPLISKGKTQFWKTWKQLYNKNSSDLHTVVNGVSKKEEIVDAFKTHFVKISEPNTLIFLSKNHVYKNIEAQIEKKIRRS